VIGWQIKAIAAAAVLAIIGGILWHDHHVTKKLNAVSAELRQEKANYAALQAAQAHERKIAHEASADFESRLKALDEARAATPVRSVRLCRPANPSVSATAGAANGTDAGAAAEQPGAPGQATGISRDIGPDLYALADAADERAAQCNALIRWVRSR